MPPLINSGQHGLRGIRFRREAPSELNHVGDGRLVLDLIYGRAPHFPVDADGAAHRRDEDHVPLRSEEHTSELQSRLHLVCRLLLEKKKKKNNNITHINYNDTMKSQKCTTYSI